MTPPSAPTFARLTLACLLTGAAMPALAQTGLDRPTVIPPSGSPVAKPSGRPGIDQSVPEAVAPNAATGEPGTGAAPGSASARPGIPAPQPAAQPPAQLPAPGGR